MNAPERIWAFYAPEIAENENGATIVAHETVQHGAAPFIRADLYDTQAAEIADLRRQLAEAQGLIYSARQERDAAEDAEKELAEELRTAKRQLADAREVLLSLPAVYARQINTGVREVYDPLQRFYRMEDVLHALNPKGTADDRA